MKRPLFIFIILIIAAISFFIFFKKKPIQNKQPKQDDLLHVVCTTNIIADTVAQIGKPYIKVTSLMGAGVDPHLYRARAGDLQKLMSADIILYNGLHLEGKMADILKKMSSTKPAIAVAASIPEQQLRSTEYKGLYDPHVWHDIPLWINVAKVIGLVLAKHDAAHAEYYQQQTKKYVKKLEKLHQYILKKIQTIPPELRILVTAHDAFAYFGKRYGLQVIGLQGISTDAEIGIKDIQQLVSFIIKKNVPAIFVESSIPKRNIQAVQDAVQAQGKSVSIGPNLFSDALGDAQSGAHTYAGMIKHNVDAIVSKLAPFSDNT